MIDRHATRPRLRSLVVDVGLGSVGRHVRVEAHPVGKRYEWVSPDCRCDEQDCVHVLYARQLCAAAVGVRLESLSQQEA